MESVSGSQILHTKLQRPDLPGDFLPRRQLLEYVNTHLERPLTLISAGAGFGKSTFASSWLRELPNKSAWLSLDEQDNDLRIFLFHFVAAIREAFFSYGQKIRELLMLPQLPGVTLLKNTLINELKDLPERIFLALDDFHLIHNEEIIHIISEILRFPPKNFHLLIITRNDPPLPLSRLRSRNKMKDVRSSHLRLSDEEIRIFTRHHLDTKNVDLIAQTLESRLEGWFAGIRLALMHLSFHDLEKENIKEIITRPQISETYFLEEVLEHQEERSLEFLLKTSVLEKFTAAMTDYLLEQEDFNSQTVINELLRKNLFIINLDNEGKWFRYHHLFQSLLRKELEKRYGAAVITALHHKAAEWYEARGMVEEALYHASQTHDPDRVSALIERHMHIPIDEDKWYLLEKWLRKVPDSYIFRSPALLIARMWDLHHKNIIWAIPELLERFDGIQKNGLPERDTVLQAQFFRGVILFWSTRIRESRLLFEEVLKDLPEEMKGVYSLVLIYHAVASQMTGSGERVYRETEKIYYSKKMSVAQQVLLFAALLYMKILGGDLFALDRLTRKMYNIGLSAHDLFAQAWSYYFLGYIAFQQNRPDEAEEYFRQALENRYQLNMKGPVDSYAGMLLVLKEQGKTEEYDHYYRELTDFVHERNNPVYMTMAYTLRARLALEEGDLPAAIRLSRMADMNFDAGTVLYEIEIPRLTLCRVLLAKGSARDKEEAFEKLQEYLFQAGNTGNVPFQIRTLVLLTVAALGQDDPASATRYLLEALSLARPGLWLRPFLKEKSLIRDLLLRQRGHKELGEFVALLLKRMSATETTPAPEAAVEKYLPGYEIDPLTSRELDILHLLAKRMSNKEIAAELFIAESTVKRHTITIYQKLNVHKRREAVAKAGAMGIL